MKNNSVRSILELADINNGTLVDITLLIAESKLRDKEMMMTLVLNLIN